MIQLNHVKLTKDIIGDKQEIFLKTFPQLFKEVQELIKKPRCGTCINNYFTKMFAIPNIEETLSFIYKDEIKLNRVIRLDNPNGLRQVLQTFDVPFSEWDEWFNKNCQMSSKYQIRLMNTMLNEATGMVKVSIIAMKEV